MSKLPGWYWTILLCLFSLGAGLLAPEFLNSVGRDVSAAPSPTQHIEVLAMPTLTATPLVVAQAATDEPQITATATVTLAPPPTLEPPTNTPQPSLTPSITPTRSVVVESDVQGIQGLPLVSTQTQEACELRSDWTLEYTIQSFDTLSSIADQFGTFVNELVEANCIENPDVVRVGQVLLVPGDVSPVSPEVVCEEYIPLQPLVNAWGIPGTGQLVFNWDGTKAPRNLLRLYPPDFDFSNPDPSRWYDYTFDLRQNYTITDLEEETRAGGVWHWQVYPLNLDFQQICPESPLWFFTKEEAPTPTPTSTPIPVGFP